MSRFTWPKSPFPKISSAILRLIAELRAAARCGARVKHLFVMRHGKLTGGLCPNDGENIVPRHWPPSDANNAQKAAPAGDRGFETGQKREQF